MDLSLFLLPFLGFFIGTLVTLIGGGGGAIYIPLLMFGFGLTLKEAAPISLATMLFTSFFGSISHYRHGHVHLSGVAIVVFGSVIGTGIGTFLSIISPEFILQRAFGVLMLILLYPMILKLRSVEEKITLEEVCKEEHFLDHPLQHGLFFTIAIFLIGLFSGVSAGLFGVSGCATLIIGFYLIGIKPKIIVGTSIFVLFFKALSGVLWHLPTANINWLIVIMLGIGTGIGGFFGPIFLSRVDHEKAEKILEKIFIAIVAVLGIIFLVKPI